MRHGRWAASTMAVVGAAALLLATQPAAASPDPGVRRVDAATAQTTDAALIAAKTGWGLAETQAHLRVQDRFGELLARLAGTYPETFAGGALAERPGAASVIRFKGQVPSGAAEQVAAAGIPVDLRGGSEYSQQELRARSTALFNHLVGAGHAGVVTAVMPEGFVDVTVTGGTAGQPTLPTALRDDVRIRVVDGPASRTEDVVGGARVRDDGVFECTSGFTVEAFDGGTGVATAGHCSGINELKDPNSSSVYVLTHEAEHRGFWGDMEWKSSSNSVDDPAEYFASDSDLREVNSVESYGSIANNNWYCVYGRASNNRECDEVYSTFVNASFDGVDTYSLVAMKNDNTVGGDSGGPWSYGTEATGIHTGDVMIWLSWRNVFTVAELFPLAIGVFVRTQ